MDWKKHWERWKHCGWLGEDLQKQLENIQNDEQTLEDCFYKYMDFGTGGMRGELGPGTNRMNTFTIRRAAEGLARYIEEHGNNAKTRGVVIAFDSRHRSREFALETALTLGAHHIQTYIFRDLRPTPELSYAVRHLNTFAGVMITASHNPPEYNGFKLYGSDGGQFPPEPAKEIMKKVNEVEDELAIKTANENDMQASRLLQVIGEDMDTAYNDELQTISIHPELIQEKGDRVSIVFTPLHGTANIPVTRVLETSGFTNVHVVKEQALPDPEFSTVKSPNPEDKAAFELAIEEGVERDADVLIATDPDADRVGLAVKGKDNHYQLLSGNQTGALMLEYLLSQRSKKGTLSKNGVMLKTIVTSEIGRAIAENYGVTTIDTLTGFKFIGEKMKQFEKENTYDFQFGYEESYGYLIGDFVRDKDAVQASLLAAEMTLWYKEQGKTLYDGLIDIYEKYGFYLEDLDSLTLKGKIGEEKIEGLLKDFRQHPPLSIGSKDITVIEDYQTSERWYVREDRKESIHLPTSNVLKYKREDGAWFCIRPSGTEPKVKFYFGVNKANLEQAEETLLQLKMDIMTQVHQYV
ncbi:alpha-phosphoglucomutase [Alteribacillus persepolensis]|uniref:Phosphoglucomutase n=1 Tax=Alteribacillus persepolensis TaxID=568899 RepID=A0A1G8DAS3_9BACI|nr:phospho-sugar mutase [Alteribacillus persepolensis]SDH54888.1 alpha-phosphoglucomutase [Alteribacillus persepolensis]